MIHPADPGGRSGRGVGGEESTGFTCPWRICQFFGLVTQTRLPDCHFCHFSSWERSASFLVVDAIGDCAEEICMRTYALPEMRLGTSVQVRRGD